MSRRLILPLSLVAMLGCSKVEEPPAPSAPPPSAPAAAEAPASAKPAPAKAGPDLAWEVPKAWQVGTNPSPMRKATYKVPKAAGDDADAEVSVSQVGGGIDDNIKRWAGQFGGAEPKRTERAVGPVKVTVVELSGTFQGGGMMGGASEPKKSQALLGAIVTTTDPPYFFKMTGPEKTVKAARKDFDHLVDSFREK